MLKVDNLTKVYPDGTRALQDVSFTVNDGEFLIIIGLSGSGKSTLLRCINRLVDPTSGTITWNGKDVTAANINELRLIRREIGMIFQHFNLVKRLSVQQNVLSGRLGYVKPGLALLNRFPVEDHKRATRVMERVDIAQLARKRADELSGGQQQRVGIARVLMQDPKIILADEPVSALDPVLAHNILQHLEKLNQDGVTIICSLHYLDLVQRYATRVIGLRDGKIVYRGTREEIRSMTDSEFQEIYGEEAVRIETGRSVSGG
ncbi:MAG: phosphonate ABC transporter ATP-binding protein [Anaerolineae bacterium]|nr:phosphonate ABC transporter ATP-binding protein [Anaerolineae bacterium]